MSTVTFYIAEDEKQRLRQIAASRGLTAGKLASQIVRAWVQKRMSYESEEGD